MRLVTFTRGDRHRLGVLVSRGGIEHVVDVGRLDPSLPSGMRALLGLDEGLERVARLVPAGFDPRTLPPEAAPPLAEVILAPVVPDPAKLICIGLNYRDHAAETGQALPEVPTVFAKFPNVLIGAGAPIVIPRISSKIDYEAELAFVIGRRARHVPEFQALRHVAGYTCFNDVTARDVQKRSPQWTLGKSFDTFGPLGPALVTADQVPDPHALAIRCSVGGETLQESSTGAMVFSIAKLVSFLSEILTLEPGDVVVTGTPAGVGFVREPPRYLRAGETVRVEIEGVGVLENPVVAEASA
jgi:2-keto-4-pentenoate hydratase/2-oxohepta-3-ene-1,7-dioic acid hydratase in catechol pathway